MGKAPYLVIALLLVPWPASGAMPDMTRWAAPERTTQPVRAGRASRRQHLRTRRAVEAGQLESARSNKAGETSKQRSSASHRSPSEEPEIPSATQRAAQEKLAPPHPLSKLSPALPAAPSVPINPPEIGKPGPEASPAKEPPPQPAIWSDAEVIGALRRCVSELAPAEALVQALEPIRNGQCGTPAPVRLWGFKLPITVELSPPAVVNCSMVAKLHDSPATRTRSHMPRILRVPPRAVSVDPIAVLTGSAMVAIAGVEALDVLPSRL